MFKVRQKRFSYKGCQVGPLVVTREAKNTEDQSNVVQAACCYFFQCNKFDVLDIPAMLTCTSTKTFCLALAHYRKN